jgi:hypothetical protein
MIKLEHLSHRVINCASKSYRLYSWRLPSAITLVDTTLQSDVNETIVLKPPNYDVYWGWKGNFTFTYWDVANDTGIENATVLCEIWSYPLNVTELGNGTYMVELDTTSLPFYITSLNYLVLTFQKENYQTQVATVVIRVLPIPTAIFIQVPEFNINYGVTDLIVPVGDLLDIRFQYNNTDSSDGYVGGQPGAYATANLYGPTLVRNESDLNDLGNGSYSYLFDTTESWLFEATGGVPFPHELPYYLDVEFSLENRTTSQIRVRIYIVEIPTELEALNFEEESAIGLSYVGDSFIASLRFSDVWPGHGSVPISNATVTVENSAPYWVEILGIAPDAQEPGVYNIEFNCIEAFSDQSVSLTLTFEKENYATQTLLVEIRDIHTIPTGPHPPFPWAVIIIILSVAFYYYRKSYKRTESANTLVGDFDTPTSS